MNHLDKLIKKLSEDLKNQIENNHDASADINQKLLNIGINPSQPTHKIIEQLITIKMNLDEIFKYFKK